jgi:hypothetical protein
MGGRQGRGDIIPGFDCRTGKAVGYVRGEWEKLLESTTVHRRDCYLIAMDADGLPLYEIPIDEQNPLQHLASH